MEPAILGISPGTKAIGIVVLKNGMLESWNIHTNNAAALTATSSIIEHYAITGIAILKSHTRQGFPRQKRLMQQVQSMAEATSIPVRTYSTYDLRKLMPDSPKNKKIMFSYLTELFPELIAHYHKYCRERNSYQSKIFEAAACAYATSIN
jgi:hypothetical protein